MLKRALVALAVLGIRSAEAQTNNSNCAPRPVIVEKLTTFYGEQFIGGGLQSDVRIIEVWVSEYSGTWTILLTRPSGIACIMASGTNWRDFAPLPEGVPG